MTLCDVCGCQTKRQRFCSERCKKQHEFTACGLTRARRKVAELFQRMIRAEAGAQDDKYVRVVRHGQIVAVMRSRGLVACVTCGQVTAWNAGIGKIHTGHFVPGRSGSILFDERNVSPQCWHCNIHRHGATAEYRQWMVDQWGETVIEELQQKRHEPCHLTRVDLVDKWLHYSERLKRALTKMKAKQQ